MYNTILLLLRYYSMLISMAAPLNLLTVFVFPFQLMQPSAKRNKKFVKIGFLIYTFFYMIIYVATNFLLMIMNYINYFIQLPFQVIFKSRNGVKGILVWILWIFGGLFYQSYVFAVNDLPLFVQVIIYYLLLFVW